MVAMRAPENTSTVSRALRLVTTKRKEGPRKSLVLLTKGLAWAKRFGRITLGLGSFVVAGFVVGPVVGLLVMGAAWFALDFLLGAGGKA